MPYKAKSRESVKPRNKNQHEHAEARKKQAKRTEQNDMKSIKG